MNRKKIIFTLFAITILLPVAFYFFYGHNLIAKAYNGHAPDFLKVIIDAFYPRFWAEKNRLDLSFFVAKANQVAVRYLLVTIIVASGVLLSISSSRIRDAINDFSIERTTIHNTFFLRILFFLIFLIATRNVYEDLRALRYLEEFYKPVFLLNLFNLPFPGKTISFLLYSFLFLSIVLVIFGIKQKFFSVVAVIMFLLYQGYLYSFEKIDHGYAPFTYAAILFPFLIQERANAKEKRNETYQSWALRLILIVTAMVYFLAGLEKLLIAGLGWVSPVTFRSYLLMHETELGKWVAGSQFLCFVLPLFALVFQLFFPLVLFIKKLRWFILPLGVIFHFGTVLLFGISSYENPWLFNYIFFINWHKPGLLLSGLPAYFRS